VAIEGYSRAKKEHSQHKSGANKGLSIPPQKVPGKVIVYIIEPVTLGELPQF